MSNPTSPSSSASQNESQPLYFDVSPQISLATKVTGIITVVMVILSFIFCMVKGSGNHTFYLLACNLIISSIVACVTAWWYKNGDLQANKYWYVILVGAVIVFQCLTTDIYVFNVHSMVAPTVAPMTTTAAQDMLTDSVTASVG